MNNTFRVLLSSLLILCNVNLFCQKKINGLLVDKKELPIPYANITIQDSGKGTITNKDGKFEISIHSSLKQTNLIFSCIGYKSCIISIDSLIQLMKKEVPIEIQLPQQNYELQEIIVLKQEILKDPKLIFTEALNNAPNLLTDKASIGKYYFRQTHRDDSSMNRLIEAAISIYDPGINKQINECKFNVDQLRSSLDNRILPHELNLRLYRTCAEKKRSKHHPMNIDPRIPKAPKKHKPDTVWKNKKIQEYLTKIFDDHYASLSDFFIKSNMIRDIKRGRRKRSSPINPKFKNGGPKITDSFVKEHTLKLDTILLYDDEPVYKIKILPSKKYPGIEYQESRYIPIGWAYIRIKDFAFLGLDYAYIANPKYKGYTYKGKRYRSFNGNFQCYFQYIIRFKEYNHKLHLSYLYYSRSDYNDIPFANLLTTAQSEYVNIPPMNGRQLCIQEMVNTEIITDSLQVITEFNQRNWKGDIFTKLPYDNKFWENFSITLPTQEDQLLKENLIKEIQKKTKK